LASRITALCRARVLLLDIVASLKNAYLARLQQVLSTQISGSRSMSTLRDLAISIWAVFPVSDYAGCLARPRAWVRPKPRGSFGSIRFAAGFGRAPKQRFSEGSLEKELCLKKEPEISGPGDLLSGRQSLPDKSILTRTKVTCIPFYPKNFRVFLFFRNMCGA
jgi:hypothetical protein